MLHPGNHSGDGVAVLAALSHAPVQLMAGSLDRGHFDIGPSPDRVCRPE